MEIIRTPRAKFDLDDFLRRPLIAHLATSCEKGARDNPVWFLWEDGAIWILAERGVNTFQERVAKNPSVAVGLVDFNPTLGTMEHVSIRGQARIVPWDERRASRLFSRYFSLLQGWDSRLEEKQTATGETRESKYLFIRVNPETIAMRDSEYRRQVLGLR